MYDIVMSIVIYKHSFSDLEKLITEFFRKKINQKLVIVDNSPTRSFEVELKSNINIMEYDIEYIYADSNFGYASANNRAIEKFSSKTKYFLVSNPDIFFKIEELEKLKNFADEKYKNGGFGIISPKIQYEDGELQYLCKLLPTPMNLFARRFLFMFKETLKKIDYNYEYRFTDYNEIIEVPFLSGCFMFLDATNLRKENGFDDNFFMYLEDTDLSRRMFKYGNYFYPHALIQHGFGKASFKSYKMTLIHIRSAIKYFNKWGWFIDKERKIVNKNILRKYTNKEV